MRYSQLGMIAIGLGAAFAASAVQAAPPAYKITKTVMLGAPDGWDYLTFDATSHRVYVTHSTEVTVVDGNSGEIIGRVQGFSGVHGIAAIPELGKGYTNSREKKAAIAFDLATLKVLKEVPVSNDPDALIYDPATKHVFDMNGDGKDVTVIDPANDTAIATIPLGGVPEFAASDKAGHVFVNIEDTKEIVRIDAKANKIDARWPIADCQAPHGLSIDAENHRLFTSCVNQKLLVVDSTNGQVLATLPIGRGTDATIYDAKRKLAFSSNGDGTLSAIRQESPDKFTSAGDIQTQPFARTMALDPETGRIYLVTADLTEVNPKAESLRQRYQIKRGTVQLLFLDPS